MFLDDIIKNYKVEDNQYECKSRLDRENPLGWLKTVDGFANSQGGIIFVGVEDKTNKLIGFETKELDKEKMYFYHTIKEHLEIIPNISSEILSYTINDKVRYILKINIQESQTKPIILMYQGLPCIFKRRDGYTSAVTTEELIAMSLNNKIVSFDSTSTKIKFNINDFKKLCEFYNKYTNQELTEKKLASINFFDEHNNLSNGALLFKDDYDGEETSVVCSIYEGMTRGDNKVLASNRFKGNLIDTLKYMWDFVILHMNKGFIKKDTYRVDIDAFPRRSVFESLINALAHRDYFIKGSDIFVDIFKNRLVISSPGSIFRNSEYKTTYHFDKLISNRRNQLICNVFVLCNVMESKGTGFKKILDDYKESDERHKPFIKNKYNQFSITLPDLTNPQGVDIDEDAISLNKNIENSSKYDIKILLYCYGNYKSIKEITTYLNLSNSSYIRKNVIDNLVNQNFLLLKETSKEKQYITNEELVKKI